jgi:hypothetical protein
MVSGLNKKIIIKTNYAKPDSGAVVNVKEN